MDPTKRAAMLVGLVVFLLAAVVYFITLSPTVPFWDSGEFIAVSYILGIPHPPGTPFYVLLGRIATLIPWASVAQRVNGLSALAAALTVWLTYLTALKLVHVAQGTRLRVVDDRVGSVTPVERNRSDEWIAIIAAFSGALLLAFSDSFWENSIEAEVYALMSLAQILVFWLGLRWWEAHERRPTAGPLLVCVYVMWLCVGLHLGVGIMGLPLILLVLLVDRRAALVFAMPFLSVLFVTTGLERMAGAVLALSMVVLTVFAARRQLNGWVWLASAVASLYGLSFAFGDKDFTWPSAMVAVASLLVPLGLLARRTREGRILALALFLMAAGYSTHLYLPIRAAQHPAINEAAPDNWKNLRDQLERKQYGESNMLVRRGTLSTQLDKEFWRYFSRQWPLFPTDRLWGALLPLLLGVAGAAWQGRRDRTSFLVTFVFLGLTTAGMIAFLNFSDREVRERDYFFQSGYHAYALWIALGAAWLIGWVRDSFATGRAQLAAAAAAALLMAMQPFLLMKNLWFTHDRRGNEVARDYAYNMLAPLEPNSFVFTNGDNDTFPLWYIQQVEGVRKDVRVVNLSLLNTDWYIRQLRDEEPKVPIALDDKTVDVLGMGILQDHDTGEYVYTNRFMVGHIIQQSRTADGHWKKQPYFAVTVPDHMGLDKYFTHEGLVFRVNPDTTGPEFDEPATRKALYETFRYKGLFKADGSWDSTIYKDENASTLSRNYAQAHMQLAQYYRRMRQIPRSIAEWERVERMFPGSIDVLLPLGASYVDAGDTAKAIAIFSRLARLHPDDVEVRYFYGVSLVFQRRLEEAMQEFERAMQLDPDYAPAYLAAYSVLWESGQRERGLEILERWGNRHPEDAQARALLGMRQREMGITPRPMPAPPPVMPNLP
ncbi:MAG: protein O-mannosyl-transferase family [Candidatus Eiseniibacteriota bacterium]